MNNTSLTTISIPVTVMQERMALYRAIRTFFESRHVSEVETPILSPYGTTDMHIDSFISTWNSHGDSAATQPESLSQGRHVYLHTSPEFYMKRLLAADFGDCFQLARVFRNEAESRRHMPEFTMLEWYRLNFSMYELMEEVAMLVKALHQDWEHLAVNVMSYREAFANIGVNPHRDTLDILKQKTVDISGYMPHLADCRDEWLDFLLVTHIEDTLGYSDDGQGQLTFLTHYPASMAALAKKTIDDEGNEVAERFELYYRGIELANGFHELTDADEQLARFETDNQQRQQAGKPIVPYDSDFIAALQSGMPDCSGVALGIDRLLMLKLGLSDIHDVIVK